MMTTLAWLLSYLPWKDRYPRHYRLQIVPAGSTVIWDSMFGSFFGQEAETEDNDIVAQW